MRQEQRQILSFYQTSKCHILPPRENGIAPPPLERCARLTAASCSSKNGTTSSARPCSRNALVTKANVCGWSLERGSCRRNICHRKTNRQTAGGVRISLWYKADVFGLSVTGCLVSPEQGRQEAWGGRSGQNCCLTKSSSTARH